MEFAGGAQGVRSTRWPLRRAVALSLAAGAIGFVLQELTDQLEWPFPSAGTTVTHSMWNVATIALTAWALWHYDGLKLTPTTAGFTSTDRTAQASFPWALAAAVLAIALATSAVVGDIATSGDAYGNPRQVALGVVLAQLLIRYPLTVIAEEVLFRGVLQPRLGRTGPVLAAMLWAGYHLQQIPTMPSLIAFGIGLGYLRWRTGDIRTTVSLHYLGNAAFFLITYA